MMLMPGASLLPIVLVSRESPGGATPAKKWCIGPAPPKAGPASYYLLKQKGDGRAYCRSLTYMTLRQSPYNSCEEHNVAFIALVRTHRILKYIVFPQNLCISCKLSADSTVEFGL